MKTKLFFSFALAFLVSMMSRAQDNFELVTQTTSIHTAISKQAKAIKSLKSDFVQTKHMDFLETEIITKGKFYFKSENKLRWEYTQPFNYLVIINDNLITIKDEERKNQFDASASESFKHLNELLVGAIQGNLLTHDDYETETFSNDEFYMIKLFPQNEILLKSITEIQLYFSKDSYEVKQVKMVETSNDYTLIIFNNKILNASISNDLFVIS